MSQTKFLLDESRIPQAWYNINADMPVPPQPVLHPGTKEPVTPDFLSVLFPMSLIMQEMSPERWIEIPNRCVRCTNYGDRLLSYGRCVWRKPSIHQHTSITNMKGSVQ